MDPTELHPSIAPLEPEQLEQEELLELLELPAPSLEPLVVSPFVQELPAPSLE